MTGVSEAVRAWVGAEAIGLLERHRVPGLSVGLCDRTGPLWSAGYGTTAREDGASVSTTTIFSLQSASKMYTATAVLCAVRDGLVDLDVPLTTYLPAFTVNSLWESTPEARMTLRHLLSHRAGFIHEAPRGSNYDDSDVSFEDHCASISETTLEFPVGDRYSYSNLGIDLAALVLQRVSRLDFATYIDQVLLEPLGLNRTTFDLDRIMSDPDRAIGHTDSTPPPLRVPMLGAGGGYASVDDALRYVAFHLICSDHLSRGRVRRRRDGFSAAPHFMVLLIMVCCVFATLGQTDMRGLVTAGRAVRLERIAGLASGVTGTAIAVLAAHRCFAGRSSRGGSP